jgi:hypothetical protein
MYDANLRVTPDARLHAEVPLIAFLRLFHLWASLFSAVLG